MSRFNGRELIRLSMTVDPAAGIHSPDCVLNRAVTKPVLSREPEAHERDSGDYLEVQE
jgi:hypothetical protein